MPLLLPMLLPMLLLQTPSTPSPLLALLVSTIQEGHRSLLSIDVLCRP
jgi:hypothetical protein